MKGRWAGMLPNDSENEEDKGLFTWMGEKENPRDSQEEWMERGTEFQREGRPIEPDAGKSRRPSLWKWIFFLLIILYGVISYYHGPLLTRMGQYLVVEHEPAQADLIVCMMGENVDRGLEAARVYGKGLAPQIFVAREEIPDGMAALREEGIDYPESRDLMIDLLVDLGVPRNACLTTDQFVGSTFEEIQVVREVALEKGFRSFLVVTSPTHTRRTYMTFRNAFEEEDVDVRMVPTEYSGFQAKTWWKSHRYVQEVIVEYQKLIYYTLKYFW